MFPLGKPISESSRIKPSPNSNSKQRVFTGQRSTAPPFYPVYPPPSFSGGGAVGGKPPPDFHHRPPQPPPHPADNFKISFGPWMKKQHHKQQPSQNKAKPNLNPPTKRISSQNSTSFPSVSEQLRKVPQSQPTPVKSRNESELDTNANSSTPSLTIRPNTTTKITGQIRLNHTHSKQTQVEVNAQKLFPRGETGPIPIPLTLIDDDTIKDSNDAKTRNEWDSYGGEFIFDGRNSSRIASDLNTKSSGHQSRIDPDYIVASSKFNNSNFHSIHETEVKNENNDGVNKVSQLQSKSKLRGFLTKAKRKRRHKSHFLSRQT